MQAKTGRSQIFFSRVTRRGIDKVKEELSHLVSWTGVGMRQEKARCVWKRQQQRMGASLRVEKKREVSECEERAGWREEPGNKNA